MKRIVSILMAIALLGASLLPAWIDRAHADQANLIANPSVETIDASGNPTNWTPNTWGTSNAALTVTGDARTGSHALSVSATTRTDGDAKWMPDPVAVTAGQTYTYSDYSMSTAPTQLDAVYTDASGNVTYNYLETVQPSDIWQENSVSLNVPAGEVKAAVWHILPTTGTLTTDDFSLSAQTTPSPAGDNLIANPSMETANGSTPAGWQTDNWGTNTTSFSYDTGDAHTGSSSAKVQITSYTDGDAKWYFTPVAVQPSTQYTFTDYYKATTATNVVVRFDDGFGNYTYADDADPLEASDWTLASATFTTPSNAKYVTVLHVINSVGTLQTDDASLVLAQATGGGGSTDSNLVPNPMLSTVDPTNPSAPASWWSQTWGTNTTKFSFLKTGYNDTNSLKAQITSYTSGASEWMFASQPVAGDTQYKFSDDYQSNIPSEIEIEFNMADGTQLYQEIGLPQTSKNWTQFTTVFDAPVGAQSFSAYQFIQKVGYVTTDNYSVTPYTPVSFNEPLVTLSFDDGYASTFDNGMPLLQKYGFTSTQFIITDEIGGSDFMTPQNLQTMYQAGNEIASHTVTHDDMTQETSAQLKTELSQSQKQLKTWVGVPITDMAYPFGLYNTAALTSTAKYYTAARGVEPGLNSKDVFNPYDLKVENVFTTTTTAQVADWVKQAQATNTWLILVYHSVSPTPTDGNNVTPTQLDDQLAAIKASGVKVENMNTAYAEVKSQL